jgi:hypothetical protein
MYHESIWNVARKGGSEFKVKFQKNNFFPCRYEMMKYKQRKLIFKEGKQKLQLMIYEELKLNTIKRILQFRMGKNDCLFNFLINEKMFDGNSRVAEISTMTEQIEIRSFTIQEKI